MNLRKLGLILACLVLLTGIGAAAHASDVDQGAEPLGKMQPFFKSNHFGKDWGFAIGVKSWVSEWSLPLTYSPKVTSSQEGGKMGITFDSDRELAYIPTFMVRYNNFFIGGSYMPETDYEFQTHTLNYAVENENEDDYIGTLAMHPISDRKEWDLNLGYFITPNLAVSLGYKSIDRDYIIGLNFTPLEGDVIPLAPQELSSSITAKIIGLSGSFPIARQFSLNSNFAYGLLGGDDDGNYYFGELGLNYAIPVKKMKSSIILNVGYRFQRLDIDEKSNTLEESDVTSGITFGMNLLF